MRVLIVDDEAPARDRLRSLLGAFPEIEVAGEAENGEQAIERIAEMRPDLVFLDIQMPGCSGLEVASALPAPRPKLIFCTAFDQYAVDAFELHAVDYLLKPVTRTRLVHAIERVRDLDSQRAEAAVDHVTQTARLRPSRFLGRKGSRYQVVPQPEVTYFSSEDGLTVLHTAEQRFLVDPTLNEFEKRLDPVLFYRISRTAIVSLNWVRDLEPVIGGYGQLTLKTGVRLEVSRRRFRQLLLILGGEIAPE